MIERMATILMLMCLSACATTASDSVDPAAATMAAVAETSETPENSKAVTAAVAENSAGKPELICRKERSLGSHIPKKVCRTQAQIDAMERAARCSLLAGREPEGIAAMAAAAQERRRTGIVANDGLRDAVAATGTDVFAPSGQVPTFDAALRHAADAFLCRP